MIGIATALKILLPAAEATLDTHDKISLLSEMSSESMISVSRSVVFFVAREGRPLERRTAGDEFAFVCGGISLGVILVAGVKSVMCYKLRRRKDSRGLESIYAAAAPLVFAMLVLFLDKPLRLPLASSKEVNQPDEKSGLVADRINVD